MNPALKMRSHTAALACLCGWAASLAGAQTPAPAEPERLPKTAMPLHYDLHLHPVADKLTFSAEARIDVRVIKAQSVMVLNARSLVFDAVTLDGKRSATVTLDSKLERASLHFADSVAPGTHSLRIRYHGAISQNTLGFFAMDYESGSGKHRTLATNFEPSSERMLMPSWDEPDFKATFQVTVDAPLKLLAVSNMPIETETPIGNGLKRVRFAATPKMSSYLLFLAIGDFERIADRIDGIDVGVIVARGEADRGRYALTQALRLMHYYNDYFGVRYPLPKLDLVAAPGEIEGGAMENWGSIFYSQDDVLFDPKASTEDDRQQVFLVVAHEMAHQWFGDLVTMSWWDNLWLNEGFASWMETKAPGDLHPDWQIGLQRLSIAETGMRADAKASTHPVEQPVASAAEAELAFDDITYDKGSTVIGMLEDYVGAERFRDGVRNYMRAHAFGNTVSADLWEALQAAAGKPVRNIAEAFTRRPGLPLVTVAQQPDAPDGAALAQSRFFEAHLSGTVATPVVPWPIPLAFKTAAQASRDTTLLSAEVGTITFGGTAPVIVNAGRKSYTRVRYSAAQFDELASHFASLAAADQIGLLRDAWALGQSQYAPIANLLVLIDAAPPDADPLVWLAAVHILGAIDFLYTDLPTQAAFRAWARSRLAPLAARIGWNGAPNEPPTFASLRMPLMVELGRLGDPQVIAEARRRYAAAASDPSSATAESVRGAREIVMRNADEATFNLLLQKLHATHDTLEKQNLFEAASETTDAAQARRLLDVIIGPDAPAGSMPGLLLKVASVHPDLTWQFALAHVDAPGFPMDRSTRMLTIPAIPSGSADLRRVQELQSYAAQHLPAAAARSVAEAAAQIELNAQVRSTELPQIDAWLAATQRSN